MANGLRTVPLWFRIVAVVLLLWAVIGCYTCVQQFRLGAEAMGPATEYDRRIYAGLPVWYNAIYAVAVGTGLLGALALLTRSALARPLYAISLVTVVIQFGWLFATTDIVAAKGVGTVVPLPLIIVAMTLFGLWLAGLAQRRGWLG